MTFNNYTWVPTLAMNLHFNCSQAATLWDLDLNRMPPSQRPKIYSAVRDGLQDHLQKNNLSQPPEGELFVWLQGTRTVQNALEINFTECRNELCPLWGFEGNSDIAGRGMLATYLIQAVLVSLYVGALLAIRFDKVPKAESRAGLISRTLFALQHSTLAFLNASFVFAIAMLSASLMSIAKTVDNFTFIASAWALTILMPISSVIPVVLLQLAASDMLRRNRGRILLWALVDVLIIIILVLSFIPKKLDHNMNGAEWKKYQKQADWEVLCINTRAEYQLVLLIFLAWAFAGSLLLGITSYLVGTLVARLRHSSAGKLYKQIVRVLWWTCLVLAFVSMWLCLIWFIQFQSYTDKRAAVDNKDTEWSFGQILAFATWVPVLVEFGYLWWERPLDALNGRLMHPYEVKEVSKQTQAFEMSREAEVV
ncbi:hypothetical protein HBH98_066640 [Parastagonospora nodorum]|nr:hypothetical protein HBH51_041320 [Parastagonospora nodorum]KAH4045639.1 hypothetical protein HBH49_200400 [Parastagonospora nodorum]KAH4069623.1 hypothetical protein HBH50_101630 [Parastagonospora nodorum]KAH4090032.1 hypothetical protein HBH48_105410 [Parastagonospora nodorum]KAH4107411.1 hypothetical protein HBH46_059070 [Parastagonospora nodorum]